MLWIPIHDSLKHEQNENYLNSVRKELKRSRSFNFCWQSMAFQKIWQQRVYASIVLYPFTIRIKKLCGIIPKHQRNLSRTRVARSSQKNPVHILYRISDRMSSKGILRKDSMKGSEHIQRNRWLWILIMFEL